MLMARPALAEEMDHSDHDMTTHSAHTGAAAHIHHSHGDGDWMVEYRFMRMSMGDLLDGTDTVNTKDISGVIPGMPPMKDPSKQYRLAPVDMTMDMHMLMLMYGLTESTSLMAMASYRDNEMDIVMHTPMADRFATTKTDGLGDALVGIMTKINPRWTASVSISLPFGDIDQRFDVVFTGIDPVTGMPVSMTNTNVKAGYPMQLGSGTFDLIPGITYSDATDNLGWGFQASYTERLGENDNDYSLGNVAEVFGWAKYVISSNLLVSGKATYKNWRRIDGQDPELNPELSPVTDPNATGGQRLDLSVGLNGFFGAGHSIGLEVGVPVYQDLNRYQMEAEWIVGLSYQYMQ
ncbi:MAG: hypothetical protein OER85_06950 [Gammaproteobacteria bacterium]|nr:hypothetical protein [Gammaproteobacteria bacterium]